MWADMNKDGVRQPFEPPLANTTANLRYCDEALAQTAFTDANGTYMFEGVEEGRYYVEFILPSYVPSYRCELPDT